MHPPLSLSAQEGHGTVTSMSIRPLVLTQPCLLTQINLLCSFAHNPRAIVGLVIGLLIALAFAILWVFFARRRARQHNQERVESAASLVTGGLWRSPLDVDDNRSPAIPTDVTERIRRLLPGYANLVTPNLNMSVLPHTEGAADASIGPGLASGSGSAPPSPRLSGSHESNITNGTNGNSGGAGQRRTPSFAQAAGVMALGNDMANRTSWRSSAPLTGATGVLYTDPSPDGIQFGRHSRDQEYWHPSASSPTFDVSAYRSWDHVLGQTNRSAVSLDLDGYASLGRVNGASSSSAGQNGGGGNGAGGAAAFYTLPTRRRHGRTLQAFIGRLRRGRRSEPAVVPADTWPSGAGSGSRASHEWQAGLASSSQSPSGTVRAISPVLVRGSRSGSAIGGNGGGGAWEWGRVPGVVVLDGDGSEVDLEDGGRGGLGPVVGLVDPPMVEGLLNPRLGLMSQESTASLGDHEDYSRPIGGVCFVSPCFSPKSHLLIPFFLSEGSLCIICSGASRRSLAVRGGIARLIVHMKHRLAEL
jgi:hypothetical protein